MSDKLLIYLNHDDFYDNHFCYLYKGHALKLGIIQLLKLSTLITYQGGDMLSLFI